MVDSIPAIRMSPSPEVAPEVAPGRVGVPEPAWPGDVDLLLGGSTTEDVEVCEDVVVAEADLLVGVPVYRGGEMVERCLDSLVEPGVQVLIVDNGSDEDVQRVLPGRGVRIRNAGNRYVNPAWNQMMAYFLAASMVRTGRLPYDALVLANSDLVLDAGWSSHLRACLAEDRRAGRCRVLFGMDAPRRKSSIGAFFAMPRRAVIASYPIPGDLLVLGGDDFILHVCHGAGIGEATVTSVTMTHVDRGTYDRAPEVWSIARRDTDRWNSRVLPDLVPRRVREVLLRGE